MKENVYRDVPTTAGNMRQRIVAVHSAMNDDVNLFEVTNRHSLSRLHIQKCTEREVKISLEDKSLNIFSL